MRESSMTERSPHPLLADLPVFAPDAELWQRIAATHRARRNGRRNVRWAAIAAAAAIVVGATALVPSWNRVPTLADGPRESQALEREWRMVAASAQRPAADLARLHVIDAALQAAYDRGAHDDEIQPLWKQRNQALRGLILTARTDAVTRI